MVFTNVSKNFTNTVKSRPPLVVFTVCLLGIIITTFCLAYYVHNQDKIPNIDAKDDWLSLLKHFNTFDVCMENTNGPVFKFPNKKDTALTASIVSFVMISKLTSSQKVNVQGLLPLQGWSSRCTDKSEIPTHLQIAFTLPKIDQNRTDDENICVTLTGPASFMPKIIEPASCGPASSSNAKKWAKLTTKSNSVEENDFCAHGSLGKLQYDIDYSKSLKFDMFLSAEDRLRINSHLIVTSCFLVFIVVLITCYALFKSKNGSGGDSKQLLTSKGMYL